MLAPSGFSTGSWAPLASWGSSGQPAGMDERLPELRAGAVGELLRDQDGVVARAQLRGVEPHAIRRMLRRGELVKVTRGVYVEHSGPLTEQQRCWATVLHCWPAALAGSAALGPSSARRDDPVDVVVSGHRTQLHVPTWMRVTRRSDLATAVQWNSSPPRLRYDEAVLDAAIGARGDFAAVAVLADAVQSRRTTADRLLTVLGKRSRAPRRRFLTGVLGDIAEGACSALEREYLVRVERAHGLPRGRRQVPGPGVFRDVDYGALVVELDGRMFHDGAVRFDADLERDLDTVLDRRSTVRIGWGQAVRRSCATAGKLLVVMAGFGIPVDPHPCGPGCPVAQGRAA